MGQRQAWTSAVTEAMKRTKMTRAKLAANLRKSKETPAISERTVRAILDGDVDADPSRVAAIAKAVGLEPLYLFRLRGWIKPETAAAVNTRAVAAAAIKRLNNPIDPGPAGAGLLVQDALQLDDDHYQLFVHTRLTSGGRPYRDYVGVARPATERAGRTARPALDTDDLLDRLSVSVQLAPALVEDSAETLAELAREWPQAQAWLWVPRLMASRPAVRRVPLPDDVHTVVVVGDHCAGAEDIGAYLADEAGWGYVNTAFEAQRAFGRNTRDEATHAQRCLDVATAYLHSPLGAYRVIAHGDPATSGQVVERAAETQTDRPPRTAVVYARAGDRLLEYGERMRSTRPDPVIPGEPRDFRRLTDQALDEAAQRDPSLRTHVVDVELDPEALTRRRDHQKQVDLDPLFLSAFHELRLKLHPD